MTQHAACARTQRPTNEMPTRCIERSIDLDAARYSWRAYLDTRDNYKDARADRHIDLTKGRCYWRGCITPFDGRYIVHTILRNPGDGVATQDNTAYLHCPRTISATWGTALMPVGQASSSPPDTRRRTARQRGPQ